MPVIAGVAVVTPTRDRPEILAPCIEALLRLPSAQTVVVDSASEDHDASLAPARAAGLRIVRCERPGASIARNAGLRATSAPVVAFTDDDCRPEPEWLERVVAPFEDPRVGFVTGRVEPDREDGPVLSVLREGARRRFEGVRDPAGIGHAANMAVRREAFEAIGGFDEAMGPGALLSHGEEHDLFWRLLRAGWVGVYAPDAVVVHHQWRDSGQALRVEYHYGLGSGAFVRKASRIDRGAARALLGHRLWHEGLAAVGRSLRRGHRRATLAGLMRTFGTVVGLVRAGRVPVVGDHYSPEAAAGGRSGAAG